MGVRAPAPVWTMQRTRNVLSLLRFEPLPVSRLTCNAFTVLFEAMVSARHGSSCDAVCGHNMSSALKMGPRRSSNTSVDSYHTPFATP
jgi:hypothetical protein